MAQRILLKSLTQAQLCASCHPWTRPLPRWLGSAAQASLRTSASHPKSQSTPCKALLPGNSRVCAGGKSYKRLLCSIPQAAVVEAAASTVPFEPTRNIKVTVSSGAVQEWQGGLLVLGVFSEDVGAAAKASEEAAAEPKEVGVLAALDETLQGALTDLSKPDFKAKQGTSTKAVRVGRNSAIKYVAQVGLGDAKDFETSGSAAFRAVAQAIVSLAKDVHVDSVAVSFPTAKNLDVALAAKEITAQLLRSSFESTRFKGAKTKKEKEDAPPQLGKVEILVPGGQLDGNEAAAVEAGEALARGSLLAMYLVDAPPNACTPTHLAEAAAYLAERHSSCLKLEVLEEEQCRELGMGCFLGVAECSAQPPKFIHLTYSPPSGNVARKIAVVGKGLTFDSGGYNLKVGPSMIELMKFDMGGAAATLGAANIIGALKPDNVEIHFIVASCENMVDGKGLRPGDVLTAANGKTVEVNNTDAEGRLTLADAMWFAQEKCGVTAMVDAATLTGACIVALGTEVAGLFSPSDAFAATVEGASKETGEKVWRMPMVGSYAETLKSSVADMCNTGSRWGGSITAALFLQEFVNEGVEWAHVDMAGPVWSDKAKGPTGFGARLLAQWAITQRQVKETKEE